MPPRKRRQRGPRGEGTFTYDRRRQRWRVTVRYANGQSKTKYFATESDAHEWHEAQKLILRTGQAPAPALTLSAALAEYIERRTPGARPGTLRQYDYRASRVLALLGDIPVTAITPTAIAGMSATLASNRLTGPDPGRGLAAATIENIVTFLHSLCEDLIALGQLTSNPVNAYRRIVPKRSRGGRAARAPVVLDPAHCRALLAAIRADDGYLAPFVAWLICLPLRVSELRGLRWANVDAGRMIVRIVEQRTHADPHAPGDPKTAGSVRDLPLTAKLLRLAGRRRGGTDLVFPNVAGGPVYDETLRGQLDRAVARLAREGQPLPAFRVHDLRHTAASNMLRLGCPINYERALLGHAPADITEQYARPDVEALRPWVDAWSAALFSRDPGAAQQTA